MNYYFDVKHLTPPPRVHPLLLSLNKEITESEHSKTFLKINMVSENDERINDLASKHAQFYTPPENFPPLEIHVPGQNGKSSLFDHR